MKTTSKVLVALTLLAISGVPAVAQSADEIVRKHLEATGGEANWKKVNSMKLTGIISAQGIEMSITETVLHNQALRQDITIMGVTGFTIIKPTEGWTYQPVGGRKSVAALTKEQIEGSQDQLNVRGDLVGYQEAGATIESLGKEKMEGKDFLKVRLTATDRSSRVLYFDSKNFFLVLSKEKELIDGKETESITRYSNFKRVGDGLTIPMTIKTPEGIIKYSTVEVNPEVSVDIFRPTIL